MMKKIDINKLPPFCTSFDTLEESYKFQELCRKQGIKWYGTDELEDTLNICFKHQNNPNNFYLMYNSSKIKQRCYHCDNKYLTYREAMNLLEVDYLKIKVRKLKRLIKK